MLPGNDGLLHPVYALEPRELEETGLVRHLCSHAFCAFVTGHFHLHNRACHLDVIGLHVDVANLADFGFVHMAKRKMLQQVLKGEDGEFLLQQLSTLRTDTF